jgi:nucleotide-binding universal stress UspA family protein
MTSVSGAPAGESIVAVDHHAVLVPLDGTRLSEHALEPARWLAANLGATVHTVIVGYVDDPSWYTRYVTSLRNRWPQVVPHFVGDLDVAGGIVDTARALPHCLVCMGTRGRSRTAALLGSKFTDVARSRAEPLIAIGPNAATPERDARRVVACVDGTPTSEQILPLAAGWARLLAAHLDIVAVVEPPPPLPTHSERHHRSPFVDPAAYVTELAHRPALVGVNVEAHLAVDPLGPEQGLADHLRDHPAALVATTSHLRAHHGRALHGSTAARIIRSCPVPVLVQPAAIQSAAARAEGST